MIFADVEMSSAQIAVAAICTAAVGVVVATATGVKGVISAWFKRWTKSVEAGGEKYLDGIKRIAEFHECLQRIGRLDFVDRVLIFTGTNCGGVPEPKKPYIVRCVHGWSSDPTKHPEQQYDFGLRVDAHYMQMIAVVIEKGFVEVRFETMPADSLLRGYYLIEGVNTSRLYKISLNDTALIYASVACYTRPFSAEEVARIDREIDRLRSVME